MQSSKEFGQLLFKLSRLVRDEMTFTSYAARLSMLQFHTLVFLKEKEKIPMREIAEHFHIEMSTATSLLDKLVTLRLVRRVTEKNDRRVVSISLTKKGKDVLAEALLQHNKKITKMLSVLSEKDREKFIKILQNIVANLEKQYEK